MATGGREEDDLNDEYFDVVCTICARRHRNREAKKYCTDCKKNLCLECEQTHRDHSEGHRIIDVASLLTLKCDRHRDELINIYCVDHDELLCTVCTSLDHKTCQGLKSITESLDELSNDVNVQGVPDQLNNTLENVGKIITGLDEQVSKVSQLEENYLEEIETYADKLMSKILVMKQNAKTHVKVDCQELVSDLMHSRQACVTGKDDINTCMNDINDAGARKAHLFVLKKKGQKMRSNVDILCEDSRKLIQARQLMFKPNWKIEDTLKDFESLGSDSVKYKVSFKGRINIEGNSAIHSDVAGCCQLPDGTILLSDINNKIVKHVNPTTGEVKKLIHLQGKVAGITCINENEVAVCNNGLQIVSLEDMSLMRTIRTNISCKTVACHNDNIYVSAKKSIHVFDLGGNPLRTIEKNNSGQDMFCIIGDITLNKTGDRLYVADWTKGFICIDKNGQEIFHVSSQELKLQSVCGLCIDSRGNVFVCGYWNNSVVQLTEDGQVIGTITFINRIEKPRHLLCDREKRRLYVAGCSPDLLEFEIL